MSNRVTPDDGRKDWKRSTKSLSSIAALKLREEKEKEVQKRLMTNLNYKYSDPQREHKLLFFLLSFQYRLFFGSLPESVQMEDQEKLFEMFFEEHLEKLVVLEEEDKQKTEIEKQELSKQLSPTKESTQRNPEETMSQKTQEYVPKRSESQVAMNLINELEQLNRAGKPINEPLEELHKPKQVFDNKKRIIRRSLRSLEVLKKVDNRSFSIQTKRVLYCSHQPFGVDTKDTLGRKLFGKTISRALYVFVTNRIIGLFFLVIGLGGIIASCFVMANMAHPIWSIILFFFLCSYTIGLVSTLNTKVLPLVAKKFTCFIAVISCIIGNILWAFLLHDFRSIIVIVVMPNLLLGCFQDAMPRSFRIIMLTGGLICIIWTLFSLLNIADLHLLSKFNREIPVPITQGTVSLVAAAANFQFQYLTLMIKIFINTVMHQEYLTILDGKLICKTKPVSEANEMLTTAEELHIFHKLPEHCKELVTHISGSDDINSVWEIIELTEEYMISSRQLQNGNIKSYKIEFLMENITMKEVENKHPDLGWTYFNAHKKNFQLGKDAKVAYRKFSPPPPLSPRYTAFETSRCTLENHGLFIMAYKTTEHALSMIPKKLKEGSIDVWMHIGGKLYEQLDENIVKSTLCVSANFGGWVPGAAADAMCTKELKKSRKRHLESFNVSHTRNPTEMLSMEGEHVVDVCEMDFMNAFDKRFALEKNTIRDELLQQYFKMFKVNNKFETQNPFDKYHIKAFFEHLESQLSNEDASLEGYKNNLETVNEEIVDDMEKEKEEEEEKEKEKEKEKDEIVTKTSNFRRHKQKHMRDQVKRVVYAKYTPIEIDSKKSIGFVLFGTTMSEILHSIYQNFSLGLVWLIMVTMSSLILILVMHQIIAPLWGYIVVIPLNFIILGFLTHINVQIVSKLASHFLFWWPLAIVIIVNIGWTYLISDGRGVIIILMTLTMVVPVFADGIHRKFSYYIMTGSIFAILWNVSALFQISTLSNSTNNAKISVPLSVTGAKISLSAILSSFIFQYLTMGAKVIFVNIFYKEVLVIVRAPLQSVKLLINEADYMLSNAMHAKVFDQLSKMGQTLGEYLYINNVNYILIYHIYTVSHITGRDSQIQWTVLEATDEYIISTSMSTSTSRVELIASAAYKIHFHTNMVAFSEIWNMQINDSKYTWKVLQETPNLIHRYGYRIYEYGSPVSDRIIAFEQKIQMFSNMVISACKTTLASKENVPNNLKKNRIFMELESAGTIFEKLDDDTLSVVYEFSGDLGGWIPKALQDTASILEVLSKRKQFLTHFSLDTSFLALYDDSSIDSAKRGRITSRSNRSRMSNRSRISSTKSNTPGQRITSNKLQTLSNVSGERIISGKNNFTRNSIGSQHSGLERNSIISTSSHPNSIASVSIQRPSLLHVQSQYSLNKKISNASHASSVGSNDHRERIFSGKNKFTRNSIGLQHSGLERNSIISTSSHPDSIASVSIQRPPLLHVQSQYSLNKKISNASHASSVGSNDHRDSLIQRENVIHFKDHQRPTLLHTHSTYVLKQN